MLKIPLQTTTQSEIKVLEINQDSMPQDLNKLTFLLQREKVPIGYWLQVGWFYFRNGQEREFVQVMQEALKDVDKRTNQHLYHTDFDRIDTFNALASYFLMTCENEANEESFLQKHQNATMLINDSDNVNSTEQVTWITKCFSQLITGQLQDALSIIQHCKTIGYFHPLVQILKGYIEFQKSNYQEALTLFKQVLMDNPITPPSIRFGIGLCYYRLGNIEKARFCFERLIELEPDNVMALIGLSVIEGYNNMLDRQGRERSAELLEKAFQIDPNNLLCLKYLADHYFFSKKYQLSEKLCMQGLKLIEKSQKSSKIQKDFQGFRKEIEFLKSDFNFILGKIQHVQEKFEEALQFYSQAVKSNNLNYSAQLGLGKIQFFLRNYQAAEQCFDSILQSQKHKDSYEALKLQAQVKSRLDGKQNQAIALYKRVLELNPKDHETNLEIAILFEQSEPQHALVYYENCLRIHEQEVKERKALRSVSQEENKSPKEDEYICPELLNNVGVLRMEVGKVHEAQDAYQTAIKNCKSLLKIRPEDNRLRAICLTAKFNLGIWYEQHNRYGDASERYKQIISEEPAYVDAYLRLAYLARNRGNVKRALEYIEQAKNNQVKKPEEFNKPNNQFCMKGKILHDHGEINQSQTEYVYVLQNLSKKDSYAAVGLANINYDVSTQWRESEQKQAAYLQKAMEQYCSVLEYDEANCFATLGIGNVLAEHGKLQEAMEIYKVLKETNPNMYQPLINQAHMHMASQSFEIAINLYKQCLDKFFKGKNQEIEMYLAKAYFKTKKFKECTSLLTNLLMRYPQDLRLKLNMGLCFWTQAYEIFNMSNRRVAETREAINNLRHAEKLFIQILNIDQQLFNYFPSNLSRDQREIEKKDFKEIYRICDERLNDVRQILETSEQYLKFDEEREEKLMKDEEEKRERLLSLQKKQEEEQAEKLEQEKARIALEQEIAEKRAEEAAQIALDQLVKEKKRGGGGAKDKLKGEEGDDFIDDKDAEDEEEFLQKHLEQAEGDSDELDGDFKSEDEEQILAKEKKRDKKRKDKKKKDKKEKKEKKDKKDKKKKDKKKKKLKRMDEGDEEKSNKEENKGSQDIEESKEKQIEGEIDDQLSGKKRRLRQIDDEEELVEGEDKNGEEQNDDQQKMVE